MSKPGLVQSPGGLAFVAAIQQVFFKGERVWENYP